MSSILAPIAIEAGKQIIRRLIRNRRGSFCPHCGGRVLARRKRLTRRR